METSLIWVDSSAHTLSAFGETHRCAIGKGGTRPAAEKREGDGATPLGRWPILAALLRPDRMAAPVTVLPWRWLRPNDGWSDGIEDPVYNRPIVHPHSHSAERLWREDAVYDIIVVLGTNMSPVKRGAGSAIFWHIAQPDFRATEGCVAIEKPHLARILPSLTVGSVLEIR